MPKDTALTNPQSAIPNSIDETLALLTARFERGGADTEGSGLGLAIVAAIAERIACPLSIRSPRVGSETGFEVSLTLPTS